MYQLLLRLVTWTLGSYQGKGPGDKISKSYGGTNQIS